MNHVKKALPYLGVAVVGMAVQYYFNPLGAVLKLIPGTPTPVVPTP